jgi:hypothetical protein
LRAIERLAEYTRAARGADAPIEIARQFYISLAETREAAQANLAASLPNAKPTPAIREVVDAIERMLVRTRLPAGGSRIRARVWAVVAPVSGWGAWAQWALAALPCAPRRSMSTAAPIAPPLRPALP